MNLKIVLSSILLACVYVCGYAEQKDVPVKGPTPTTDPTHKPRVPAKKNVEAWIDGNVMTITFINPEGEAVLSLESSEGIVLDELTYSTEAPMVVDLTPYEGVAGFTLTTESGHTYIGYLNI